jgi:hypothetical protein
MGSSIVMLLLGRQRTSRGPIISLGLIIYPNEKCVANVGAYYIERFVGCLAGIEDHSRGSEADFENVSAWLMIEACVSTGASSASFCLPFESY